MRKKIFWIAGMVAVGLVVVVGIARYIEFRNDQTDPNWQISGHCPESWMKRLHWMAAQVSAPSGG